MTGIEFQRSLNHMSQIELAQKLGVTQACISMWENEKASPRMPLLKRMAKIFVCNVDDLIANSAETQDPTEAI